MKPKSPLSVPAGASRSLIAALLLCVGYPAFGGDASFSSDDGKTVQVDQSAQAFSPEPLTLSNLFTAGWTDPYGRCMLPGGAPDMALLHVQTNFLEREFRFDFYSQRNTSSDGTKNVDFLDGLVAYSFNRRFMLEVITDYEWKDARPGGADTSGAASALQGRLQLVDVPGSSYALNFRATSPNDGINNRQTEFTPSLAGWEDLTQIGLKKVGLYFSVQEDRYAGPAAAGSKHNDIGYDVSLAKTWTDKDFPLAGNFTTFAELYGITNLDGNQSPSTSINVTPGVRFNVWHGNIIMAGLDIPVSSPHDFDLTYRITFIVNF